MEKNAIIAIVLSLLVLLAWQQIFVAPQQQRLLEEQAGQKERATGEEQGDGESRGPVPQEEGTVPVDSVLPSVEIINRELDERAQDIVIETPLIHAILTTQGARLKSWKIPAHKDTNGEPVEFVSDDAQRRGQYPLEIFTGDAELDNELNTGVYQSSRTLLRLEAGDEAATLSLTYETQQAGKVTKQFLFRPDSYMVEMTVTFSDPTRVGKAVSVVWGPGLGSALEAAMRFEAGVVAKTAGAVKPIREKAKKIEGLRTYPNVEWGAVDRKYFTAALFPENTNSTLSINSLPLQPQGDEKKVAPIRKIVVGVSQPLSEGKSQIVLYAGPKKRAELQRAHEGFEKLINYGFFGFIAEPLAKFMDFLYLYVHNYGVVIICLTILIKILFFPLTHKSYSSMKKMQDIQPQMKALQAKYKDDKQLLNQEMMKLYKEKGVNPMGGCFPMVLQIPVFFALYQTLSQSIELRGASFLWISDLSASETLFFKPLVLMMGVSMFLQQSMTPTATDNKQAQMFKFMPILFTAMFWNFPAGLVLYWFMNNILTIGQQYLINRRGGKPAKQPTKDNEETLTKSRKRRKKGK